MEEKNNSLKKRVGIVIATVVFIGLVLFAISLTSKLAKVGYDVDSALKDVVSVSSEVKVESKKQIEVVSSTVDSLRIKSVVSSEGDSKILNDESLITEVDGVSEVEVSNEIVYLDDASDILKDLVVSICESGNLSKFTELSRVSDYFDMNEVSDSEILYLWKDDAVVTDEEIANYKSIYFTDCLKSFAIIDDTYVVFVYDDIVNSDTLIVVCDYSDVYKDITFDESQRVSVGRYYRLVLPLEICEKQNRDGISIYYMKG